MRSSENVSIANLPATQALIDIEERLPAPEYFKRIGNMFYGNNTCIESSCQQPGSKRRRKSCMDMADVLSGVSPVEESIAFPSIEWVYDDDDQSSDENDSDESPNASNEDDDEEEDYFPQRSSSLSSLGKRGRCGGLTRSKSHKISLVSLVSPASESLTSDLYGTLHSKSLPEFYLGDLTAINVTAALEAALAQTS